MHIHLRLFIALLLLLPSLALPTPKLDEDPQTSIGVESGNASEIHSFQPRQDNSTSSIIPASSTILLVAAPEPTESVAPLFTQVLHAALEPTETISSATPQTTHGSALGSASTPGGVIHVGGTQVIQAFPVR
ncbi:hypothetical protein SISNIDRAFT_467720 [Sistotremastrum niveocremeum HHB9708]|uniref:Uncharacterized protein n=1 Tax=Sistotremastrum niveocremeum HHB9708 TaxID=1314777 RepID=A0A164SH70_9AGAM|nr:hypothetical protein SISNIDRAFT_467720 [Sistotremastrum niveocremeum HHB9708]